MLRDLKLSGMDDAARRHPDRAAGNGEMEEHSCPAPKQRNVRATAAPRLHGRSSGEMSR
jgi:hypothetical protein